MVRNTLLISLPLSGGSNSNENPVFFDDFINSATVMVIIPSDFPKGKINDMPPSYYPYGGRSHD
jgi:hypothetical protein